MKLVDSNTKIVLHIMHNQNLCELKLDRKTEKFEITVDELTDKIIDDSFVFSIRKTVSPLGILPTEIADLNWESLPISTDRYEIKNLIAKGGMGSLYEAFDRFHGRKVALKMLKVDELTEETTKIRFLHESRIHSELHHRGIPPLYDVGRLGDGRPFICMKWVDGKPFNQCLVKKDFSEAAMQLKLKVFVAACSVVVYIHNKGIIHRDINPNNILMTEKGRVWLIDWGLSKVIAKQPIEAGVAKQEDKKAADGKDGDDGDGSEDDDINKTEMIQLSNPDITQEGLALGTPSYMPPEQANGIRNQMTSQSDIFSLGAVLFEILTGQPPYQGKPSEVRSNAKKANLTQAFKKLDQMNVQVDLIHLVKSCLSPKPDARPVDANEVGKAVIAIQSGQVTTTKQPWWQRLWKQPD